MCDRIGTERSARSARGWGVYWLLAFSGCSAGGGGFETSALGQLQLFVHGTPVATLESPPALIFEVGDAPVGGAVDRTLTVRNASSHGELVVREVTLEGDGAGAFQLASIGVGDAQPAIVDGVARDVRLLAGETLEVVVRYVRQEPRPAGVATVVVSCANVRDAERVVAVPVVVGDATPVALVTPAVVEFASVAAGTTASRELRVTNTGSATLEVRAVRLEEVHPGFSLSHDGAGWRSEGGDWLPGGEERHALDPVLRLAPGKSTAFAVRFAPDTALPAKGRVVFETNDGVGEAGAELVGNANQPCLEVVPGAVQFGAKLVGQRASLPVQLRSCGSRELEITALQLTGDTVGAFALDAESLPGGVLPSPEAPLRLPPGERAEVRVTYTPPVESPLGGDGKPTFDTAVLVVDSDAFEPTVEVPVSGLGSTTLCPTAVGSIAEGEQVIPQTALHLSSAGSSAVAGEIVKRLWSVEQPPGSASTFLPSASFPNPVFEVNVAGTYVFRLDVWDENGVSSCLPWEQVVLVIPDEALHVELLWHTPGDPDETDEGAEAGSDLDLHFVHLKYAWSGYDGDGDGQEDPWFAQPFDCFWYNAKPEWASFDPTVDDDPGLDRDDTDGAGPENLNLNQPQDDATYGVGVHYWADHGYGDAYATVRIYVYSTLVFEAANVRLSPLDLWDVARIHWPAGAVNPVLVNGEHRILMGYSHPLFAFP